MLSDIKIRRHLSRNKYTQKKRAAISRGFNLNLAVPTLPVRYQTSTIGAVDFTSVFGMGTGVSPQLYPPGNFQNLPVFLEYRRFKIKVLYLSRKFIK